MSVVFGVALVGCATSKANITMAGAAMPTPDMSASAPRPDRRIGLKSGWFDAAQASWNMSLVSTTQPSPGFINRSDPGDASRWNSDLAFTRNYVIQGNFSGYQVWDVSNPTKPTLFSSYLC